MKEKRSTVLMSMVMPVLAGFIVMGVVDVSGIVRTCLQQDFSLSDKVSGLLPSACYLWFFLLSLPAGLMAGKVGRKKLSVFSMAVCSIALIIPGLFRSSLLAALCSLALLGIGSTVLMVSLNPMVKDAVGSERTAGVLSIGSSLKALTAVAIPILVGWTSHTSFGWQGALMGLGLVSGIGSVWMWLSPFEESAQAVSSSFKHTLSLFGDKRMLGCFLGAALLVGIDVVVISYLPTMLMNKGDFPFDKAVSFSSIYPFSKMVAALLGGVLLLHVSASKYTSASIVLMLAGALGCFIFGNLAGVIPCVILFGFGYANMFSVLYAKAMNLFPGRENEVSSLMIMSLCGGALFTPLVGLLIG